MLRVTKKEKGSSLKISVKKFKKSLTTNIYKPIFNKKKIITTPKFLKIETILNISKFAKKTFVNSYEDFKKNLKVKKL